MVGIKAGRERERERKYRVEVVATKKNKPIKRERAAGGRMSGWLVGLVIMLGEE